MSVRNLLCIALLLVITSTLSLDMLSTYGRDREIVMYIAYPFYLNPRAKNFNPFSFEWRWNAYVLTGLVYERLAVWLPYENKFYPILASSWDIDKAEKKVVIHLRRGVVWHDGEEFTCRDLWTTYMVYKAMGTRLWRYLEGIECIDSYTAVLRFKDLSFVALFYALYVDGAMFAPYHVFGRYAEEIAKTQSLDELRKIYSEIRKLVMDRAIGTGPYTVEKISASNNEVVLRRFDGYWDKEKISIDKIVIKCCRGEDEILTLRDLDFAYLMRSRIVEELRSRLNLLVFEVYEPLIYALLYNFDNEWLRLREVRMAIAHAIDRAKVAKVLAVDLAIEPIEYPVGLSNALTSWFRDLVEKRAIDPYRYSVEKASELLEKIGFTKRGGRWYTPKGEVFQLTLVAPTFVDLRAIAEEIAEHLRDFGIEVKTQFIDPVTYFRDILAKGKFDLAIDYFYLYAHPCFTYRHIWLEHFYLGIPRSSIQGTYFPRKVYLSLYREEVDLHKLVEELEHSFDIGKQRAIVEKLAYATNYYLPQLTLAERKVFAILNKERFTWIGGRGPLSVAFIGLLESLVYAMKMGYLVPNPSYWGLPTTVARPTATVTPPRTVSPTAIPTTKTVTMYVAKYLTVTRTLTAYIPRYIYRTKTITRTIEIGYPYTKTLVSYHYITVKETSIEMITTWRTTTISIPTTIVYTKTIPSPATTYTHTLTLYSVREVRAAVPTWQSLALGLGPGIGIGIALGLVLGRKRVEVRPIEETKRYEKPIARETQAGKTEPIATKKCPFCGKDIPQNALFCPYCGAYLAQDTTSTYKPEHSTT